MESMRFLVRMQQGGEEVENSALHSTIARDWILDELKNITNQGPQAHKYVHVYLFICIASDS